VFPNESISELEEGFSERLKGEEVVGTPLANASQRHSAKNVQVCVPKDLPYYVAV
jgi:hypothetical protein